MIFNMLSFLKFSFRYFVKLRNDFEEKNALQHVFVKFVIEFFK